MNTPPDYLSKMQHDDGTLSNADLIAIYERGIDDLRTAVKEMSPEQIHARPVAGKWSTQECVSHIADTEIYFTDRIIRTIAMDTPLLMSADETHYIARLNYQSFDMEEQLQLFSALRKHAVRILKAQAPEVWQRTAVHSAAGLLTLRQIVFQTIRHLRHHLHFIFEKQDVLKNNAS